MNYFTYHQDIVTGKQWLETILTGKLLINTTLLNKDTAFTPEERSLFKLNGKLPICVETLSQQVARAYSQYKRYTNDLSRNIYLNNLRDRNETVFYKLLSEHISEMMPVIYTPIVGTAVKAYSREFRAPRGLYVTPGDKQHIRNLLKNRTHPKIDLVVVTDGCGVLGIGDQGIGAMDIPIAKLMVYTLFAGVHPSRTLPIMLDVGTDNEQLRDDPLYLGARCARLKGEPYDEFIHHFVEAVSEEFPDAMLHWEDLGPVDAQRVLDRYKESHCTFNDDIQGTGVVTIAALLAANKALNRSWKDQRIVVFGAGTAGMGITEQVVSAMQAAGLSIEEIKERIWLLDRPGLLTTDCEQATPAQQAFLRPSEECNHWQRSADGHIELLEVMRQVKPTILIGCSTQTGAFSKEVVQTMAANQTRPIIFPLSNPTERAEAHPRDLLEWTEGKAIIATGSPFMGIAFAGSYHDIAQCNNALAFPGIGLGVLAAKAKVCTDNMLAAASQAICDMAPIHQDIYANCLPALADAKEVTEVIALAVAKQAVTDGVSRVDDSIDVAVRVQHSRWEPAYLPLVKAE